MLRDHIAAIALRGAFATDTVRSLARCAVVRMALATALAVALSGCRIDEFDIGTPGQSGGSGGDIDANWYRPTASATWQWQLQPNATGEINTTYDVDVYDIDLFDTPDSLIQSLQADGRHVICYFSAGSYEDFRDDAAEFDSDELGNTLEGFADERWLDIRSDNVRRIIQARLDVAVNKGCDGVEPDNVDGYANDTGFALTAEDQLSFNRFLADETHARGLAVGLKNDLDQVWELVDRFDFSANEQCHEFGECDTLQPFIDADKPVFNAEYNTRFVNNTATREALCDDARARNFRTLILPLDLDDSFRFTCEP